MNSSVRTLLFDIETAPLLGYTWGKWEQNVIEFKEDWYMLCFAYKWLGERKTYVVALPDFKSFKSHPSDDKALLKVLHGLMEEADIVVAHNGDSFDIKKMNARFIKQGFTPPSPYKQVDTKKLAKRHFKFESNKLDDLGRDLGVGRKMKHQGFDLWLKCMAGDEKAWREMKRYNKQDVILLEKIYLKLRGWAPQHPKLHFNRECVFCGSSKVQRRGYIVTKSGKRVKYQCMDCGGWGSC